MALIFSEFTAFCRIVVSGGSSMEEIGNVIESDHAGYFPARETAELAFRGITPDAIVSLPQMIAVLPAPKK